MKAKELIEKIQVNFNDDEEVTFIFKDDNDWVRSTDISIHDHTEKHPNGHWEMKQIDLATHKEEWVKTDWEHARKNALGHKFIPNGSIIVDTKKVIEVL